LSDPQETVKRIAMKINSGIKIFCIYYLLPLRFHNFHRSQFPRFAVSELTETVAAPA
jgi:hypothetical protein